VARGGVAIAGAGLVVGGMVILLFFRSAMREASDAAA
jgi:hypothetical protein